MRPWGYPGQQQPAVKSIPWHKRRNPAPPAGPRPPIPGEFAEFGKSERDIFSGWYIPGAQPDAQQIRENYAVRAGRARQAVGGAVYTVGTISITANELPEESRCAHIKNGVECNSSGCYAQHSMIPTKMNSRTGYEIAFLCPNPYCGAHEFVGGPACHGRARLQLVSIIDEAKRKASDFNYYDSHIPNFDAFMYLKLQHGRSTAVPWVCDFECAVTGFQGVKWMMKGTRIPGLADIRNEAGMSYLDGRPMEPQAKDKGFDLSEREGLPKVSFEEAYEYLMKTHGPKNKQTNDDDEDPYGGRGRGMPPIHQPPVYGIPPIMTTGPGFPPRMPPGFGIPPGFGMPPFGGLGFGGVPWGGPGLMAFHTANSSQGSVSTEENAASKLKPEKKMVAFTHPQPKKAIWTVDELRKKNTASSTVLDSASKTSATKQSGPRRDTKFRQRRASEPVLPVAASVTRENTTGEDTTHSDTEALDIGSGSEAPAPNGCRRRRRRRRTSEKEEAFSAAADGHESEHSSVASRPHGERRRRRRKVHRKEEPAIVKVLRLMFGRFD